MPASDTCCASTQINAIAVRGSLLACLRQFCCACVVGTAGRLKSEKGICQLLLISGGACVLSTISKHQSCTQHTMPSACPNPACTACIFGKVKPRPGMLGWKATLQLIAYGKMDSRLLCYCATVCRQLRQTIARQKNRDVGKRCRGPLPLLLACDNQQLLNEKQSKVLAFITAPRSAGSGFIQLPVQNCAYVEPGAESDERLPGLALPPLLGTLKRAGVPMRRPLLPPPHCLQEGLALAQCKTQQAGAPHLPYTIHAQA